MDRRDGVQTRVEVFRQVAGTVGPRPSRRERWVRALGDLTSAVVSLVAAFVMLGSVTPAHADVVQCGDVLGPGGRFTLEQDIVCGGSVGTGVTVQDGAILDLNGHTVDCRALSAGRCVVLMGTGAKLLNGKVQGSIHESIVLSGTGRHTVKNVTSELVDANVIVTSDHNALIDVMAESAISPAFLISGHRNLLRNSIALCVRFPDQCISVAGDGNHLIGNFVRSDHNGISVRGDNNVLRGNRAIWVGLPSTFLHIMIAVSGTGNRITSNTAITEDGDAVLDASGDCDHNTWRHNIFVSGDPACLR